MPKTITPKSTTKTLPTIGKLAPAFSLKNQRGESIKLRQFKGKNPVILYFYPKAMTPGCTVQAIGLRDAQVKLKKANVVVLGVSPDSCERLDTFTTKESLNFDLLSDPDHKVAETYGVWAKKKNYGREYMGIVRSTFIIGKDGKLKSIMERVTTKSHHDDALKILAELGE